MYTTGQRTNKCDVMVTTMVVVVAEERLGPNTALEINCYSSNPIQQDRWFTSGTGRQ